MNTTTFKTPQQIANLGFQALAEKLGIDGALQFILQNEAGEGNYTEERRKLFKRFKLENLQKTKSALKSEATLTNRNL